MQKAVNNKSSERNTVSNSNMLVADSINKIYNVFYY